MTNKFYRTETINTQKWEEITRAMKQDLEYLKTGKPEKEELRKYVADLLAEARPLETDPDMKFFGFWNPREMPSDCRVAYVYEPTYIATAILIKACLLYPEFLGTVIPDEEMRACMLACTGRNFHGSGPSDLKGAVETVGLFTGAGVNLFLELHPGICEEFAHCYDMWLWAFEQGIEKGVLQGAWGDSYLEEAKAIMETVKSSLQVENEDDGRYYIAYGSNLNVKQMASRCPDAKVIGTGMLKSMRLWFKGSQTGNYLTIEEACGYEVPVVVWKVSEQDERNLDWYEGFPKFYYKKDFSMEVKDINTGDVRLMNVFAYIMHEERKVGAPRKDYVEGCKDGYRSFGFDTKYLDEAVKASCA